MSNKYKIDFRFFKNFGLSLNNKSKYFIVYDPCVWEPFGVFNDIESAIKNIGATMDDYNKYCENAEIDYYTGIKMDQNFSGHINRFRKGFFQNLSIWELLNRLTSDVKEYINLNKYFKEDDEEYIHFIDFILSGIHSKLHSYPEYIQNEIRQHVILNDL